MTLPWWQGPLPGCCWLTNACFTLHRTLLPQDFAQNWRNIGHKGTGGTFTPASRRIPVITKVLLISGTLLTTAGQVVRIVKSFKQ